MWDRYLIANQEARYGVLKFKALGGHFTDQCMMEKRSKRIQIGSSVKVLAGLYFRCRENSIKGNDVPMVQ